MDQRGRESISQTFEERDQYGVAVAPRICSTYPQKRELFEAGILRDVWRASGGEGWTNYSAIQAIWQEIPIDCSSYVDENLLPLEK